jgi:DnaJ family protein C protein 13
MGQLRSGSEGVSAEAAGLIAMLVGGGPGEGGTFGRERAALLQNAKQALLANAGQITILVSRLRPITVSPLLSLQVVGVLEAMLCEPHSESTDDRTFHEMLRQVRGSTERLVRVLGLLAKAACCVGRSSNGRL